MDNAQEVPNGNPNSDLEDEELCDEADLTECSYPNCSERVPKTRVIQPIVYEAMFFSCEDEKSKSEDYLKYKDKPICAGCERECRRKWTLFNSLCFGKLQEVAPIAKEAVSSSTRNFERECQELKQKRNSIAPGLAMFSKMADVLLKNACKHNDEFAKLYAKHTGPKRKHTKTFLNNGSSSYSEFVDLSSESNTSDDEVTIVCENKAPKNPYRPQLSIGNDVLFVSGSTKEPWSKGVVSKVIYGQSRDVYIVRDAETKNTKEVFLSHLAYTTPPREPSVKHGNRVVIKFMGDLFYSGTILYLDRLRGNDGDKFRYNVHLDNGITVNCGHKDIRIICAQSNDGVWKDVYVSEQAFVRHCLKIYPERLQINAKAGRAVSVYRGPNVFFAEVLRVESHLVYLKYGNGTLETLHRGSPRFKVVRDAVRIENDKSPSMESFGKIFTVDMSNRAKEMAYTPHRCSPNCYTPTDGYNPDRYHYDFESCKHYPTYAIPIALGWKRQVLRTRATNRVSYVAPCGRRLPNSLAVLKYLKITKSDLEISFFTFDTNVRPLIMFEALNVKWKCDDYSQGCEKIPIPCVNSVDNEKVDFIAYSTQKKIQRGLHFESDIGFITCCECTDNCQDKLKCKCQLLTMTEEQHLRGRRDLKLSVGYQNRMLSEEVQSGIFECNKYCSCRPQACLNRVVQFPIRNHLQIFKTQKCGWGIRTLIDLPNGAFVCIYVGNLYTHEEAMLLGKEGWGIYLADLDLIEVAESSKEGYEENAPELEPSDSEKESDDESMEAGSSEDMDTQSNDLEKKNLESSGPSRGRKSRKRMVQEEGDDEDDKDEPPNSSRKYFGPKEYPFIMDAMDCGNIGRFLNHSCGPNLCVQNCFVDSHDIRYPWVSFFTTKYVAAGGELNWNYYGLAVSSDDETNDSAVPDNPSSRCNCGSSSCKKKAFFRH